MMGAAGAILPNIPRIYTALAEWLACMLCLYEVRRHLLGKKFILTSIGAFAALSVFLTLTPGLDGLLWILCMAVAVTIMYFFLLFGGDMHWKDAGYYCMRAFVLAEFAASLEWEITCYFMTRWNLQAHWMYASVLVVVYGLVFGLAAKLYDSYVLYDQKLNVTDRELISCVIIGLAIFSMSNLGFVSAGTMFGGTYAEEIYNVRTLIDFGGVAIMYAYHVQRVEMRLRQELESVQNILHNQYVQYKQAREAMEVINYKYHDLKHYILAMRGENNSSKRNEYLDQMEDELQDYESHNKTGNETLDVLLTTKGLYCKKHGITMTSVVDGSLFGFMSAMDICSIFGNALDNAIECQLKIQDKSKRLIHVTASSQKQFLIIRFENYYEGEVTVGKNLPKTTKEDTRFHGYGLKSIRYTVQKYGGALNLSTENQWFLMKILIPLSEQTIK